MRPDPQPAVEWYLLSLRPVGGHGPLRAAAARHGGGLVALSPWRLLREGDSEALDAALTAPQAIFTSPAAVAAAHALRTDLAGRLRQAIAVGSGTTAALRRAGVVDVRVPARMDSEGLLALPELAAPDCVGLVTAPGGRGELAPALQTRGARILRADVYRREPVALSQTQLARLAATVGCSVLALSSGEALQTLLPQLPTAIATPLRKQPVVAASDRLAALAITLGFTDVHRAAGPRPAQLAAQAALVTPRRPR